MSRHTLDAEQPLVSQLHALVAPHLRLVWAAAKRLPDPAATAAHHELRIAVKGLRYELEAWQDCLPPRAAKAIRRFRRLQNRLGELHDLDLRADGLLELLSEHGHQLQHTLGSVQGAGAAHPGLARAALTAAHDAGEIPVAGLALVLLRLARQRAELHGRILEQWRAIEADGLRKRLLKALAKAA